MRRARFKVAWTTRLDGAREATVTIDRDRMLFAVRPLRRRREYVLPLAAVAEMVVWRLVNLEAREKRAEKVRRRKAKAEARRAERRALR